MSVLINRISVIVPACLVLLCMLTALSKQYKTHQAIHDTPAESLDGIHAIIDTQHQLGALNRNLTSFLYTPSESERQLVQQTVQQRLLLLQENLNSPVFKNQQIAGSPVAAELLEQTRQFLIDAERKLPSLADSEPTQLRLAILQSEALAERFFALEISLLDYLKQARQQHQFRLDQLSNSIWLNMLLIVPASLGLAWLIHALSSHSRLISNAARDTESQLSNALDEISTGDRERKALTSFVAAASHDLRQPLHALGLYLGALKSHISTPQGQVILENSARSTEALNQLLNSMLDLSRLEAGVVDVSMAHINLDAIFQRLKQTFQPEADQSQLRLDMNYSGLTVFTDPVLLERILGNLVSNALNYTEQGSVTLSARRRLGLVEIMVRDTGQGIPEEEQNRIYDEFYQLHNPERDRAKGLGLGLSIVKRLSALLDLKLALNSSPGVGSTFSITVAAGNSAIARKITLTEQLQTSNDLNGLSILVIDDEKDVREGMSTLLEQLHCHVVSADSADSALTHIIENEWVPELIIADYRLRNDQTGDSAIRQVREEVNEDVPAMIVTGDTSPARLKEATASGFELLHKPVMADVLVDKITQLIGEHA